MAVEHDPVADANVPLQEDVVAGHVVLQQLLHAERSHHCGQEDADQRHVGGLEGEAERRHHADADHDHVSDAAAQHHDVNADATVAQPLPE